MAVAKRSYDGNMLSVLAVRCKHLSMKSADDRPQAFSPPGRYKMAPAPAA